MPIQVRYAQSSFSAGEISPEMYGRTDTAKYKAGLKKQLNAITSSFGGIVRRPGTRFIHSAKYQDKDIRLIRYVYSVTQSYVIELGDYYMRFYTNDGVIVNSDSSIYEISTPWPVSIIRDLKYIQSEDTMFFTHSDYPVYQLRRNSNTNWALTVPSFTPAPFMETTSTPYKYLKLKTTSDKLVSGTSVTMTLYDNVEETSFTGSGFTSSDIGARIQVNSGTISINAITSAQIATGYIVYDLSSFITAIPDSWTILHTGWSETLGYPSSVFMHQQRLIFAASKTFPQYIWMSVSGNPYNFDIGSNDDDDALSFQVADNQGNRIIHLTQDQVLLALTAGSEYSLTGGPETGITPSNITTRMQSSFGCSNVRPEGVDASVFFVQRAGRQIKALSNGGYYGTDVEWSTLSTLSRHLLETGVIDMAYQQDPDSLLWVVCKDGSIAVLTYSAEQEIAGWGQVKTDGSFLSICCIPEETKDTVYTAVKRVINGNTVTVIEIFDSSLNTDSAITGTDSDGAAVWSGYSHLNGATVDIVADGAVMPQDTVINGDITLPRDAYSIEAGLNYETIISPLMQDVQTQAGVAIGKNVSLSKITFTFHKTKGVLLDVYSKSNVVVTPRKFGRVLLDKEPPFLDGIETIDATGWDINDINLSIKQSQPLPFHLMAISYDLTVA